MGNDHRRKFRDQNVCNSRLDMNDQFGKADSERCWDADAALQNQWHAALQQFFHNRRGDTVGQVHVQNGARNGLRFQQQQRSFDAGSRPDDFAIGGPDRNGQRQGNDRFVLNDENG